MAEGHGTYHESLLQWIWQHLEFDCNFPKTLCGKTIQIIHQGDLNSGAGPDFLNAHLMIGGLHWHGSIEIHNRAKEWNIHRHHHDENYNSVVLHVVYEQTDGFKASTKRGEEPYVFELKPHLNHSLNQLFRLKQEASLPCGSQITWIHQEAFEKQVQLAHEEYFQFKTDEILKVYNPHLVPSEAWLRSFNEKLYDALGIPANRDSMARLSGMLHELREVSNSMDEFAEAAVEVAFSGNNESVLNWTTSGMRPSSRPAVRVKQAAALNFAVYQIPISRYIREGVGVWEVLIDSVPARFTPGASRCEILKNTVFLPAIYLLGYLFSSEQLKRESYKQWQSAEGNLPREVVNPFLKAGFQLKKQHRKAGLAHQYKRYCLKKQCHRCEVFKSAIRS